MATDLVGGVQEGATELKKRIKAKRLDHDLHVALLMKRHGLSKPDALILAYLDGVLGLEARLAQQAPEESQKPAKTAFQAEVEARPPGAR